MAGDWIKMRSGLLTNPKVIRMARMLAQDRFFMEWWTRGTNKQCDTTVYELCDVTVVTRVTVGSLLSVWAAVNECASQDGFIKGSTLFEVDEMAGVPGFGAAMNAIGWVEEVEDGLLFPNFHEHNTVGKERSSGAKTGAQRTKEWREKKQMSAMCSDVTVTSQGDHREEKRREEETPHASLPGFDRFWNAWPKSTRKEARGKCLEAWRKAKAEGHADLIVAHVETKKLTADWTKEAGRFVEAPLVYLNQRRWEGAESESIAGTDRIGSFI